MRVFRYRSALGLLIAGLMVGGGAGVLAQSASGPASGDFDRLLHQGFDLHQQARFSEAIPLLEQARRLDPGDYFANLLLGIDLLRTGKAADAIPRLETAARLKPVEEIPEDYLGEAEASLGHNGPAAVAYQRAVMRGKDSEESLEAWAGFALERFRQIEETLRSSAEGVAVAQRLQAAAKGKTGAEKAGDCGASIPALERKIASNPAGQKQHGLDSEAAYQLSLCYAVEAGRAAARLQSNAEDQAAVHRLRGDVLLRLSADAAAAEAEYRQAAALRPRDPGILERMSEAEWSAGDRDAAEQSAKAALAIDPHRREALRTLSSIALSGRDYEVAIPWLRQLVAEAPGDRLPGVELGRALAQTGQDAEALSLLAPALAGGYPDEKGALHALLARVLRRMGREAEAVKAEAEARRLSDAFQNRSEAGKGGSPDADQ